MNRNVTNIIRFFLDECLPPAVRDNKYFIMPFFWLAFGTFDVKKYMDFKKYAHGLTDDEFSDIYNSLGNTVGEKRPTDMNRESIELSLASIGEDVKSVLDVGCGRGYFLNLLTERREDIKATGLDVLQHVPLKSAKYVQGAMENLPFKDNSFDVVFTSHTVEHVRDLKKSISELKRVAKKKVIVVTPRQRYNFYTMDLHLNFFPERYHMTEMMDMELYTLSNEKGDWVFVGEKS